MSYYNAKPELSSPNDVLTSSFRSLKSFRDVCNILEITPTHLHYILYKKTPAKYYQSFEIPKKMGGNRAITAPQGSLKILQQKINSIIKLVYKPNSVIHGYVKGKNIVSNAEKHLGKKNVLNFDLEQFFPSINFGRVRGVLKSFFGMGDDAATVIANICCYNNGLPQGAPTSPILSNMVCFQFDKKMRLLAKQYGCTYTRYADDITFSTTKEIFPKNIAHIDDGVVILGERILNIIVDNGFQVNQIKTRLSSKKQHMGVTGITVNEKLNVNRNYIKKIRAMLRCMELNPLSEAQKIFVSKYKKTRKYNSKAFPNIMNVSRGMINYVGFIKGKQDPIFEKLALRYNNLAKEETFKLGEHFTNKWTEKVWVVELGFEDQDDKEFYPEIQGTGFFLNGVGFVTNSHVIEDYNGQDLNAIYINQSRYGHGKKAATIFYKNPDRDIAILNIDGLNSNIGFDYSTTHFPGLKVKVIGYPNHGLDDTLYIARGEITQFRNHYMKDTFNENTGKLGTYQQRIVTSARIVEGNSGGPVLNENGQVIGIATKGFKELAPSKNDDTTADNIMVKIEDVLQVLSVEKTSPLV